MGHRHWTPLITRRHRRAALCEHLILRNEQSIWKVKMWNWKAPQNKAGYNKTWREQWESGERLWAEVEP